MSVIEVSELKKSFHGRALYEDVSFSIAEGECVAITGPNGSGKSVLFRLLCGFAEPDEGSVTIDPRYLSRRRTFPDRFGVIIDRPGYIAGLTGLQNLQDLARIRRTIGDEKIKSVMESVGLDPLLRQKVRHYSLGMKQKLALSQALMESPEVLLLDEPFNALDSESVATVTDLLRGLNHDGVTIVFTSHNREHIAALATRELAIEDGRIVAQPPFVAHDI